MKSYHEKQLFFLASDRGGAKKKNLREKIERRKVEKKEGKKRYLIYPNFYPTIPERQNVPKRFRHFEKVRHHHHMQKCASH